MLNWLTRLAERLTGRNWRRDRKHAKPQPGQQAAPAPAAAAPERAAPSAPEGPRFQTSASDRLGGRSSDSIAAMRLKLRNAFTPSTPVSDRRRFAGRNAVLNSIIGALEEQRLHVIVYGDRGIGKTSLLHVLGQAAREARYLVIYLSCSEVSEFDETFRAVAGEIPLIYHSDVAPSGTEAEKNHRFADLLPPEPVTPRHFGDLFAKLTGTRVLVILDEFDRVESADFRRSVSDLIKNLSDRGARVQLVIAGVAADLAELFEYIPSIRRNVFALQLPQMKPDEVRDLVATGEQSSGINFDPSATALLVFVAHGSPYIASLLGHHASLAALDGEETVVGETALNAGIDRALEELRGRMSKTLQYQIDQAMNESMRRTLGLLGGASLFTGGRFARADIDALYSDAADAVRCDELIAALAAQTTVIEVNNEFGAGYRFVEGSVPVYLWVRASREYFMRHKTRFSARTDAEIEVQADPG